MKNGNKHRTAIAVVILMGVTVSASLYARNEDQPVSSRHGVLNGPMCEALKDSAENKDLKAKYETVLEEQKKAQADGSGSPLP